MPERVLSKWNHDSTYDVCVSSSLEQTVLLLSDDGRIVDNDGHVSVSALHSFEFPFRGFKFIDKALPVSVCHK